MIHESSFKFVWTIFRKKNKRKAYLKNSEKFPAIVDVILALVVKQKPEKKIQAKKLCSSPVGFMEEEEEENEDEEEECTCNLDCSSPCSLLWLQKHGLHAPQTLSSCGLGTTGSCGDGGNQSQLCAGLTFTLIPAPVNTVRLEPVGHENCRLAANSVLPCEERNPLLKLVTLIKWHSGAVGLRRRIGSTEAMRRRLPESRAINTLSA